LRYLYEAELEAYVRERKHGERLRRRSLHHLQGTCAFRTVPASVRVTDPLAALDYATRCLPEAVKTQTVLDTARYRQVVEETGEILPGVEVTQAQETFRVSFGKSQE
jgi:hypothetical protein